MARPFIRISLTALIMLSTLSPVLAQTATEQKLYKALQASEADLDRCRDLVDSLRTALVRTNRLWEQRKDYTDSLVTNLKDQIGVQNSIGSLLQANADTLDAMVHDYSQKLDSVSTLYVKQLRKQDRSWFLTWNGIKGFFSGVVIGGAFGLIYGLAG